MKKLLFLQRNRALGAPGAPTGNGFEQKKCSRHCLTVLLSLLCLLMATKTIANTPPNVSPPTTSTIYNTTHASTQGAEITPTANGAACSLGDLIVLGGTDRAITQIEIEIFTLSSTTPFDLTMSLYTDCSTNGAGNSPCGNGVGVLIPGSVVTVTNITPSAVGTITSVVFPYPNLDISSESDNTISVVVNASRDDVFWRINETPVVGSTPPGEPATSYVTRCGSSAANNGCSRNFGVNNNFSINITATTPSPPTRIYVDASAVGANNGTSWTDAYTDLQSALADIPDTIFVANGTYYPTSGTDQSIVFSVPSGKKLFGGFAGGESWLTQRNIAANPTILSGDIGVINDNSDNSYNIVVMSSVAAGTRLDGFTVSDSNNGFTGGAASISGSATIINCTFERNTAYAGGAISFNGDFLDVDSCLFRFNFGGAGGGAIASGSGTVDVSYSVFDDNTGGDSGGAFFSQGTPTANFDNCVFYNNRALNYQGAVIWTPGPLTMTNCTVAKNSNRRDIHATPATMTITNTIIWGNPSGPFQSGYGNVTYTIANANVSGTGNINADPLFVDINDGDGPDNTWRTADDGLLIGQCSPAVDGGNTPASAMDIVGNPRLDAPVIGVSPVDMGAYEQQDVNYPVVITDISIDNMSALITNGTICSADDTFTGDVTVTFSNFSSTGSLSLTGAEILSTLTPVPIANTTTTSTHVFTGVSFVASGQATLTAAFSDMPCTYTETISPTPSAGIGYVECIPCGTPWFDDGGPMGNFTQGETKTFCPQTTDHKAQIDFATIDIEGSGWDAIYIYDGTDNSAPQLAYFSGSYTSEMVTATATNPTGCLTAETYTNAGNYPGWEATFNCVRIFDISAGNISACDGNNTTCSTDDTYTADITVSFASKPATGTLSLSGADIVGSPPMPVAVGDITGNTYTFTGLTLRSDGLAIELSAVFSDEPAAIFADDAGNAPSQCSVEEINNLYGVYQFDSELYSYSVSTWTNVSTQTLTMPGFTVNSANSISLNPQNGLHYVILKVSSGPRRLATVDPTTGICTDIGSLGDNFSSITFAPDGTLYGCTGSGASVSSSLYTIDPATAAKTFRQTLEDDDGQVIAFNPEDGFIYHWTYDFMEKIDTGTYALTEITLSGSGNFYEPLGAVYKGNGSFYVGDYDPDMFSITATGEVTLVGDDLADYFRGYALVSSTPPPCDVSDISLSAISGCDDNSTPDPSDDFFTADVTVTFAYAPGMGDLTLKHGSTVLATKPASELACVSEWTFSTVSMAADGAAVILTAEFDATCTFTSGTLATAPASCSCVAATFTACPGNQSVSTNSNNCVATVNYTATASGTPAPVLTYSFSGATTGSGSGTGSGSTFNFGVTNVTVTATNDCSAPTCEFTVTVSDDTPPSVTCQNHTVALNASGMASITTGDVYQTGSDNCGTVNQVSVLPNSFTCSNLGANSVTLTVNDGNGNTNTCTATVTVQDNISPVAACQNLTVQLNASGTATVTAAQVNNGSSDNCSVSLSLSETSFNCSDVGANSVTLTATDPTGNSHTCNATITVQDNVLPNAVCQNVTVNLDASGNGSTTAAAVNNNSTDACGIQSMSLNLTSFTCANIGANTVTLTVTDVNGNMNTCTATVTVADNLPPMVACTNISLSLASNGYASITSPMVFNAAGSSDNCGTVNPQSVSPNVFDCGDIGNTTVTLTGNDGHGNTATCQATVTIGPFITNIVVTTTPANCGGSDGSITVTASAPGGQLRFSIDNFVTFNLTGIFNNLSEGSYPVSIMASGTSGCTASGGVAVVGSVGSVQTWYKDFDGDDYSDGNSQMACSQPNSGYQLAVNLIATSGDCNDNNPLEFPGQTWYKDTDNDGYSNGQTLVQCLKPTGYKAASQLTQTSGDCNDNNGSIHPGATETCNGLDDDCDGQVDEGLGDLTYVGNVTFSTQAQANAWSFCYTVIQGNLTIQNATIDSLPKLVNLRKVTGNVTIKLTGLDSLPWLMNLDTIGGTLTINSNSQLDILHGLDSLVSVGSNLKIYSNGTLSECCAVYELINEINSHYVGGTVSIYSNITNCLNTAALNAYCDNNYGGGGSNNLEIGNWEIGNSWDVPAGMEKELSLTIFPNPVAGERQLTVQLGGSYEQGILRIFDATGRLVLSQKLEGDREVQVKTSNWKSGIYLVQSLLDGEILTEKLIVE